MSLSENTQGKKLLIIQNKGTEFYLKVIPDSEIVKNAIPILWNNDGMYGWIPVEIVKNEISPYLDKLKLSVFPYKIAQLKFSWHQAYRLRQDVGRMLEELGNEKI